MGDIQKLLFAAIRNLKSNLMLLVSALAALCLFAAPTKTSLYDVGVLLMLVFVIALSGKLRAKNIVRRPVQLAAALVTLAVLLAGYRTFAATWRAAPPVLGVLGCIAGFYAGYVLFGHAISLILSFPALCLSKPSECPAFLAFPESKKREALCFALCLVILAPLLIIGVYNRQSADDYSYAILTHSAVVNGQGLGGVLSAAWQTNIEYYHTWQGLYSSAFLLSLQPAIFGERLYALTTPILILWAYGFVFMAVHILNKALLKRSRFFSATAALVLVTILMLWLPSPTEGLFWFNGAMNYMPWAFTNVFNICYLISIGRRLDTVRGKAALLISTALSFLTSGGNHVTAFANILFLLLLTGVLATRRRFYPLLPLAAACIGFVIMYTAPGTAIRAAYCEQQTVISTIWAVIVHLFTKIVKWFNVQWLLSLLLITPIGLEIAAKNQFKLPRFFALGSIILSIGMICGMLAVPYYPVGNFGAGRTTNVIWITFMFLSWYNYIVVLITLANKGVWSACEGWLTKCYVPLRSAVVILCLILLFLFPSRTVFSSSVRAVKELSRGTPQAYAAEWDERHKLLADPAKTVVEISPLSTRSDLLFFSDLFIGDSLTTSELVNEYYGKEIHMQR